MFKKLTIGVLIVMFLFSFSVIVGAESEAEYELDFASVGTPEQPQIKAINKFADLVEELTDGKVVIEVHHSGTIADQTGQVTGVMRGQIDMCDAGPEWFADLIPYEEISVLGSAYAYRNLDHLYQVMNGPIGQKYWEEVRERGDMVVLDTWYLGTRQLNLKEGAGEVRKPEDLEGVRLRMPGTEAWMNVGRALGAEPTSVGFNEVYTALQTGTIEGQENPLPTDYANNFHEVTHYIVKTDHYISVINPTINADLWEEMPVEYRNSIMQAIHVAGRYMDQLVLEEEATLLAEFVNEHDMELIYPDKDAFMKNANQFYKENMSEDWYEAYQEIQQVGNSLYRPAQ